MCGGGGGDEGKKAKGCNLFVVERVSLTKINRGRVLKFVALLRGQYRCNSISININESYRVDVRVLFELFE